MNPGSFFFRYRSYTPYPIVLLFALFAQPNAMSFVYGGLLIAAGEIIRLWGVAHIGSESRSRELSAIRLITSGPYAYCRNPLYAANFIIYAGVTVIANVWLIWLLPLIQLYFFLQYWFIVQEEERYLKQRFGEQYLAYLAAVPRFLLRLPAWNQGKPANPDWGCALISEKSSFLSLAGMLLIFLMRVMVI